MIAVTFALPAESSEFVGLLSNRRIVTRAGAESIQGDFHGRSIAVVHTGVGAKACAPTMAAFLQRQRVDCLISAGFAGALDPDLHVADLLIAENYSSAALLNSPTFHLEDMAIYLAELATVPAIVQLRDERIDLAKQTGAAAVDMETKFIAEACAAQAVPMISLRAISDTSDEPFPAPPHVLFDVAQQKTNGARLAFYLATHPFAIGRLRAFAGRIATVRAALTIAVSTLVRGLR